MPVIEVFCISDAAEFQELADEWNRLAAQTDSRSVFFRHEWFDAAWSWQNGSCDLRIICVKRDGVLIGICPLVSRRSRPARVAVTVLEFLQVPDSQETTVLADPADHNTVVASLLEFLSSSELYWDVLRLEKLHAESTLYSALTESARSQQWAVQALDGGINPGILLEGTWSEYYSRRSRRLKKGNNLIVNRLKRDDKQVEIHCYDRAAADWDQQWLMNTLIGLSAESWKVSTGLTLDNEGPGAFIDRLSEHAMRNAWFLVWLLTIDGEPAAMEYQLEYNGVVSGLRADYDRRFDEYSPGTLLNWRIIERLFDREAKVYWLGPGSNQYKLRWAEELRQLGTLVVYGNTLPAKAICAIEMRLRPLARRAMAVLKRHTGGRHQSASG